MISRILICFSILTILYSCVKLDEGPSYSLFTKNQRLAREWVVDSLVGSNGLNSFTLSNQDLKDLRLIFEKKENIAFYEKDNSGVLVENNSSWSWFQVGYMIEIDFSNAQSGVINGNRKYIVKRLTRKDLILEDHVSGFRLYFHAF